MSVEKKYTPGITDYISEYYEPFGVKPFHDANHFGKGNTGAGTTYQVKLYIIDSGFDDTDPGTSGIQTHIDLSAVEVIDFSVEGSPEIPSHGSLVCSLVAAPENNFGIVWVCPDAKIYLGDVDNSAGTIFQTKVAEAIEDAVAKDVDIISLSLGSTTYTTSMLNAINLAVSRGILVFASAGNSGKSDYEYPASLDGVISVGSVNITKTLSTFNTRNEKIALFAPGEDYYLPSSIGPVRVDGTSYSCPFAAGLAALYISKEREERTDPSYTPTRTEIITVLEGPNFLDCASLSYPAPNGGEQIDTSLSTSTIYIAVGIGIAFLVVGFLAYMMASKPNAPVKTSEGE